MVAGYISCYIKLIVWAWEAINFSQWKAIVQTALKEAVMRLLKKVSLKHNNVNNYYLTANVPFFERLVEQVVYTQF